MGGDDKVNTEGETNIQQEGLEPSQEGVVEYISGKENEIDQATIELSKENEKLIDLDKIKGLFKFKEELEVLKFKLNVLGGDVKEFVESMTWSKVAKLGSTVALAFIFVSCTNKESTPTPQIMAYQPDAMPVNENKGEEIQVQPSPTVVIEPTATETPPDVDLGWDWKDFEGFFRMTPTAEQMEESFKPEEGKSKYVIFGKDSPRMFDGDNTVPISEEDLENGDAINKTNDLLELELDEIGKEVLKQMFLYKVDWSRPRKDQDISMYVYVENGCPYEKDGALTVINKAENEQGFEVKVYRQEDIPWNELSQEDKQKIEQGITRVDKSEPEVVYSCNINDIRTPSTEE